jgi:putative cell wall-binding protein
MRRLGLLLLVLALVGGGAAGALLLTNDEETVDPVAPRPERPPVIGSRDADEGEDDEPAATDLGFPASATKNTVRVPGEDSVATAAAVARAVYPSRSDDTRPSAVVLVDVEDWQAAISASQLMAAPVRAPVLFAEDGELPEATQDALEELEPTGSEQLGGAQVVRVGDVPEPEGLESTVVRAGEAPEVAARIDALVIEAARRPSPSILVAAADAPEYAMPAAGWAAKSGDPVLWVTRDGVPAATRRAIAEHRRPRIYVLGPSDAVPDRVVRALEELAPEVRRIEGDDPAAAAIEFARFSDGRFGWNVVDPGHGLVVASAERVLDAPAAAPFSTSGQYGPLLLVPEAGTLPEELQEYLLDIQPGYDRDPVRGVYNTAWIVGDESAVSVDVQARLDTLLEIQPVDTD